MMSRSCVQLAGMIVLGVLGSALLILIGWTAIHAIDHISADGKVPVLDAGMFSTGLVTFQTVVGAIRSIWESQERTSLAEGLSNSTPTQAPNPPADGQPV